MTADEYTPTTEQVRFAFIDREDFDAQVGGVERPTDDESGAAFDRWLAGEHARVLREAADEVHREARWCAEMAMRGTAQDPVARLTEVEQVLDGYADRIEREGAPKPSATTRPRRAGTGAAWPVTSGGAGRTTDD